MGDVLGTLLLGDIREDLRDEGSRDCRAQGIDVLIHGIRLECGPDVILHEFLPDIDEFRLDRSVPDRTGDDVVLAGRLTDVDRDGDDVDVVVLLEPVNVN